MMSEWEQSIYGCSINWQEELEYRKSTIAIGTIHGVYMFAHVSTATIILYIITQYVQDIIMCSYMQHVCTTTVPSTDWLRGDNEPMPDLPSICTINYIRYICLQVCIIIYIILVMGFKQQSSCNWSISRHIMLWLVGIEISYPMSLICGLLQKLHSSLSWLHLSVCKQIMWT